MSINRSKNIWFAYSKDSTHWHGSWSSVSVWGFCVCVCVLLYSLNGNLGKSSLLHSVSVWILFKHDHIQDIFFPLMQVIQAVFFGICVLTDLSSLLTKGNNSQEQERQLKKLISLRDWMMAVLAFPIGVVSNIQSN